MDFFYSKIKLSLKPIKYQIYLFKKTKTKLVFWIYWIGVYEKCSSVKKSYQLSMKFKDTKINQSLPLADMKPV